MKIRRFGRRKKRFQKFQAVLRKIYPSHRKGKWGLKRLALWTVAVVFVGLVFYSTVFLPSVTNADQLSFAESTIIYDRGALDEEEDPNDHILYVIHGDENREHVPLSEIPKHMIDATIAIEDDAFYSHFGFDLGGIIKAVMNHFFGIGSSRGGSTITQQLVKNTFLSREKTITRKFNELLLAIKVELNYSKDEILELYLNNIPYGNNAHGIEAAAKTFFDKSARDLTIAESAILASLPVAPTRFSPYGSNKDLLMGYYEYNEKTGEKTYKKGRKDLVLQRMLDLKKITFEEFKIAWAEAKDIQFTQYRSDIRAPHFVFYVRERLEEKYGKEFLKNGGLRIYTTLDPKLQTMAEEIIALKSPHYEETYGAKNVALTSIDTDTGQILAYVGGKDYFDTENDGQVDVLTSRRQPGSSFKPFVYATAFQKGYTPSTVLFDVETDFGGNYQPQNFSGEFAGPVSMREALNRSLNIPAVKTAYLAGPDNVLKLEDKLSVKYEGNAEIHGVALGIGVAEVEPLSHISAFQIFAGDGTYHEPTAILEVKNSDGEILESFDETRTKKEGLDSEVAALVRHVLTDELTRPTTDGFDWNNLLQLDGQNNGAKTGTSNRKVENPEFDETKPEDEEKNPKLITAPGDSWTIGFTPHVVTGVWVGNNRGEPMKPGATGLAVAAPIWKKFMNDAHASLIERGADPKKLYNEPKPLEVRQVNKYSGKIASPLTPPKLVREEVFASFSIPTQLDDSVKLIEIDKVSGRPATEYTPFYARTRKYALTGLHSIRPDMPNWENPVQEWVETHPKFMTSLGVIMDEDPKESRVFNQLTSRLANSPDDVHNRFTQQNAPEIKILSPRNNGVLSPGQVEVTVEVSAKYGMKAVEYYFDDQLVTDSTRFPWTGVFEVPNSIALGTKHILRAVAIDELFHASEQEIEVEIAPDTVGPDIIFLGPVGRQKIPVDSEVQVLVDVKDASSGVKVVEFFLDNVSLGFQEKAPYRTTIHTNMDLGTHELAVKAWDYHGNTNTKTIPIIYDRQRLLQNDSPEITDTVSYRSSVSIDITVPRPEQVEWVELLAEQADQIVFSQKVENPKQYLQFQMLRNIKGEIKLKLVTKFREQRNVYESPVKIIHL